MASGSSQNNRYSNSSTKERVLSSIGGSVTNLSTPRKHTPPIRFTVDELNPKLTRSSWIIHASVTKKRGQVPFSENSQYTEVYLKDVRTAAQIRAVAFTEYAEKFDRLLQKGQAYTISGGSIRPARKGITTEHMFEIHFNEVSSVHVLRDHVSGSSTAEPSGPKLKIDEEVISLIQKYASLTGPEIQAKLVEEGVRNVPSMSSIYKYRAMFSEAVPHHKTRSSSGKSSQPKRAKTSTQEDAQTLLHTSSKPTAKDVNELIMCQVAAKWKNVALSLGVQPFIIKNITANNHKDCEGACHEMFERWLSGGQHTGELERTWFNLLTALKSAGFMVLVEDLCRNRFQDRPT